MNKIINVKKHTNPDIKTGDKVYLIDGSGLTHTYKDEDYYIIYSYFDITNTNEILKNLEFEVIETNIQNILVTYKHIQDYGYLADIKIRFNNLEKATFYTCSKFVRKITT